MTKPSTRQTRVLVVDDKQNLRRTLGDILEDEGHAVRLAASGEEALSICEDEEFDAILMDYRMPGIDGLEAFRRIRERRGGARVILMSAYTTEEPPADALEEGVLAFLSKPLDVELVLRLIAGDSDASVLVISESGPVAGLDGALRQLGYRTTDASSALEALELVEQVHYDLVFIDADSRTMDALELYLSIRDRAPSAVAIMLAGDEREVELARRATERSAYAALRKPLDATQLEVLVGRLTGQLASGAVRKPTEEL